MPKAKVKAQANRWRYALQAIRPATLWAGAVPVGVGTALALGDGKMRPGYAALALGVALLLQIATNLFNDYGDAKRGADGPDRLGPKRVTQSGLWEPKHTLLGTFAALAMALFLGSFLVAQGGWPIGVVGALSLISALAYTGGPMPLAYVGLGDVFVLAFFGFAAVCGTYFVQAADLTPAVVWASWVVGAPATAILVVNNVRDRHTDKQAGKKTWVVRFGATFGRLEYTLLMLGSFLGLPAMAYGLDASSNKIALAAPILLVPWALFLVGKIWREDGKKLNRLLAQTAQFELVLGFTLGCAWIGLGR